MRSLALLILASSVAFAAPVQPKEIARRFVAGRTLASELGEPQLTSVARGWVARFRQSHAGLPVIGGDLVLRIGEDGTVLRHAGVTFDLDGMDVTPRIDEARALEVVLAHGAHSRDAKSILAIDPVAAGGPRLVWAVRPMPIPELLENAIYLVDAKTGELLKRYDLIKYGKASVFLYNPIETPEPSPRDFPAGFEPTNADGFLESPLLKSYDCIDKGETKDISGVGVGGITVHICTVTPEAQSATHDYTLYSPSPEPFVAPQNGCPNAPAGGTPQPLDQFSEQHMYWHVANVYTFFRGLFSDNGTADFKLRAQPLALAVNLCTPDFAGGLSNLTGPLVPFDNAFFSPGAGNPIAETLIMGQDSIMFGQGPSYDFAYDADVVYHEFTHAVIDTLGKLTLGGEEDVWGLQDDQSAMNEGLADYFSSALAGDPQLGEYAGRNITGGAAEGAVRDLTNHDECGKDRWGEAHQDSQAFSAAVWGARTTVAGGDATTAGFDAAKARLFDRAVLSAIASFSATVDMTKAAGAIADEVGMLIDATAKQAVQDSFMTHKILPQCDRVIDYASAGKKDILGLDGTDSPYAPSGATRVPGFVQWKIDVPTGADSITAHLTLADQPGSFSGGGGLLGGSAPPKLELVAGPPGMPVQWVVRTSAGNEVATAPFSGTSGTISATVGGLATGTNYVMIVNSGGGAIAENITFDTACTSDGGCAPDMAMPHGSGSDSGCSCDVGAAGGFSLVPLLLVGFCVLLLRRRRRA